GVKAEQGREADIRYCVSCNTCWRTIVEGDALQCDNNPRVGQAKEMDWKPPRAKYKKRIVVVGSGVAGMEAAWVAAARDHQVTVFGQSAEVGGKTRIHSLLPGGENLSSIYDYQFLKATHSNVRFEFGIRASVQDVLSLSPDRVVLATGSRLTTPHFLADDMKDVVLGLRQFSHELVGTLSRQKGCLVIYDQDHTEMTYAAAEYFADYFQRVVIVTTRERIASDVSLVNRQGVYQRLLQKRVEIVTNAQPMLESDLEAGEVTVANVVNGDQRVIEDVVALTYATPRQPNDELLEPLQKGLPVDAIGDCYAPRSVLTATREGHWLGVEL
ncbi:MAG: FAD-dependent oxidoreductase, partial [Pseudomonadota bacterium]